MSTSPDRDRSPSEYLTTICWISTSSMNRGFMTSLIPAYGGGLGRTGDGRCCGRFWRDRTRR